MKRLYVFCEGPTEESFVDNLLVGHFAARDVIAKPLILPGKAGSTSRQHKGGWTSYAKARRFIRLTMDQMHADDTWFTTMLDLYALPGDFPPVAADTARSGEARVAALEAAFHDDICTDQLWRFTPYLQLHEYEALLLADPAALLRLYPDRQDAIALLRQDIGDLAPEAVNEGPETAPSKRILRHLPEYAKVLAGTLVAMEIGLPTLRTRCPHFDAWMTELERRLG